MIVKFVLETGGINDESISNILELSENLEINFKDKDYGEDVIKILIGVIIVGPPSDQFFTVRRTSYTDFKIIKDGIGNPVEIIKVLGFDVKPDFETVKSLRGFDLQAALASAILTTLRNLRLPRKIKSFDFEKFKNDLEQYLSINGYL